MAADDKIKEISRENARRFVANAPADELANWQACPCGDCAYCTEVKRARDERFATPPKP